jgi:hypothetical protein
MPKNPANTAAIAKDATTRRQLGALLQMLIQAGLEQKGDIESWWKECERIHRNEWTDADSIGEGLVPVEVPYSQPRQDMLTAQVCSVLTRQEPYMLAEDAGDSVTEDIKERVVHKFWKSAGFEQKIRHASNICTDTNRVFYRVCWEKGKGKPFSGLIFDVIHPRHMCLFPATVEGISGCRLVGHRFYRRVAEIEALQKAGVYFADEGIPVVGGDSVTEYDGEAIDAAQVAPDVTGPDPRDLRVELWDVTFRYDDGTPGGGGEKWYRATVAFKTFTLLSCQPYPYSRPWYFDASYVVSSDEAYWSPVSVARHLAGLQSTSNLYHGALYNGSMMSAFPPIFGPELDTKDFRYTFGDYVPTDSAAQTWSPTITFKGDSIVRHLEMLEIAGDRSARISANAQGSVNSSGDTTATESSIIAADVSVGIEDYIGNFGGALGDVAEFTCELLALHFVDWQDDASALKATQLMVAAPCLWEPNGKTPGNSPGARLAACEKLAQLAAQFGPMTGIDIYELTRVFIANLGLAGSDNLQGPKPAPVGPPVGLPGQPGAAVPGNGPGAGGNPPIPGGAFPPPGMAGAGAFPQGAALGSPGLMPAVGPSV